MNGGATEREKERWRHRPLLVDPYMASRSKGLLGLPCACRAQPLGGIFMLLFPMCY